MNELSLFTLAIFTVYIIGVSMGGGWMMNRHSERGREMTNNLDIYSINGRRDLCMLCLHSFSRL